jgi:bisphosphoglycerate-independent phosphoglycerate mutase (AlkP superfamily)
MVGLNPDLKPRRDHGQLIDVAPTILELLGAGIPAGMCGKPLLEWTGAARPPMGAP